MGVSLEMVLPGIAGYWVDRKLHTGFLFMLIGLAVGCTGGMWHLLRLTRANDRRNQDHSNPSGDNQR